MKLTEKSQNTFNYIKEFGKITTAELAEHFGVNGRSISATVTDLKKKGLVERETVMDGENKLVYVSLTEEGKVFDPDAEDAEDAATA